jgi:predicted DNA-binding transcriptional regulator YafY
MEWLFWISLALFIFYLVGKRSSADSGATGRSNSVAAGSSRKSHTDDAESSKSLEEWRRNLKVLWNGKCPSIEFTYDGRRRTVTPEFVLSHPDGHLYIQGYCHMRNGQRTFKMAAITTKILMKSTRFEKNEWLDKIIGEGLWEGWL